MSMPLPHLLTTPDVLSFIGIGYSKWAELREEYNIKPVTRGGKGYIYRGIDIEKIFNANNHHDDGDSIMKGLEKIG